MLKSIGRKKLKGKVHSRYTETSAPENSMLETQESEYTDSKEGGRFNVNRVKIGD